MFIFLVGILLVRHEKQQQEKELYVHRQCENKDSIRLYMYC